MADLSHFDESGASRYAALVASPVLDERGDAVHGKAGASARTAKVEIGSGTRLAVAPARQGAERQAGGLALGHHGPVDIDAGADHCLAYLCMFAHVGQCLLDNTKQVDFNLRGELFFTMFSTLSGDNVELMAFLNGPPVCSVRVTRNSCSTS